MKIVFADIIGKGEQFICLETLDSSLFDVFLGEPVEAKFVVRLKGDESYLLLGSIEASVSAVCDRCTKVIPLHLRRKFQYILYIGSELGCNAEYQCSDEDCETLYLDEAAIDSDVIVAEQLLLAIPVQRLCEESCKGLCRECGINLNRKKCKCGEINSNSPFAILKELQQK